MKCCIKNCAKDDRLRGLKNPNNKITFHLFPKDPKQRAAWLESLAIPNWEPTNRTVICSDHFKEDDFYINKIGIRRLKYGVVPVITDEYHGPAAIRICKLCLTLDAKMYHIKDHNLAKMYQDIMGMAPRTDERNRLPMGVCWECTARLQSAAAFRSKALFSDAVLQDHLKNNADLILTDFQNIHRKHTTLKSSLFVQEVFKFNSQHLNEYTPNTFIKTEAIGIPYNEEIEVEVNELVPECITIKDEDKNSTNDETYITDSVKTDFDLNEVENERDYVFENDDYSDNEGLSTEKVYVKSNNTQGTKIDFDNVILVKTLPSFWDSRVRSNDETNTIDKLEDRVMLSKPPPLTIDEQIEPNEEVINKEQINGTDEVITKVSNDAVVCIEEIKRTEEKKKVVKRKKAKKEKTIIIMYDNSRPKLLRPKKKQPYGKPVIPIDENIFTVTTLRHEELVQEILERKESERYLQAPFKCTVCYRGFPTKDKQARHVIKHSEQSGPLKCTICKIRMKLGRDMRAHMKRQHTSEFTCKLCPLVTRNKNVALGHMKFHAGSKYQCPQCSVEFEKQTTLLNHLRLKHMSDCVCELCGYTFVSKNGVQAHKRMKHKFADKNAELTGPYCEVCEVKFLTQKAHDRHLRLSSKHIKSEDDPNRLSNDPSIKSRRLGSTWLKPVRRPMIRRRDVNSMATHNGPVTCEQCGVELENLRAYASHFKYSHPGINRTQFTSMTIPYMCEHCGKMFLNTTTLAGHMWVHTGQKRFQCDHCNKTFSMKSNLAGHMRQHEPVRRSFDCRVCGKQLAFNHNLTRHMFLHTGLRPFKCDACEKAFRTSGELRAHVDHVHLKKPRPKRARRKPRKCDLPSLDY